MKTCKTMTATIFIGLREGYDGITQDVCEAIEVCQEYCDAVGLCVTVTKTTFIYKGGREPGVVVRLMNYPRFPSSYAEIRGKAITLATKLRKALRQIRVSVMFDDDTVMQEGTDDES